MGTARIVGAAIIATASASCFTVPNSTDTGTESAATDTSATSTSGGESQTQSSSTLGSGSGFVDSTTGSLEGDVVFQDDEFTAEFEAGSFSGVQWQPAGGLQLVSGESQGTFVSRIFDAGANVQWNELVWLPEAPYQKPLPDDENVESGYAEGAVDMTGNVALFHLEESGALGPGATVADASGRANDGAIVSPGAASSSVDGVFGAALDDHVDAYISIPTAGPSDFDYDGDDFTWAIWFRFDHGCATNNVFIGVDDIVGGSDMTPHLWMGCTDDSWTECGAPVTEPRPVGVLKSEQGNIGDGASLCGSATIADGAWHHMALLKSGHDQATVQLYVDGELEYQAGTTFDSPIRTDNNGDYGIGGFSGATFPSEAVLDEAAIWRATFTDAEVRALYRRGALRLSVELRTCMLPDCADDPPFVGGPNGLAGEAFTDPPEAESPGSTIPVSALAPGRYIQYRLNFASWAPNSTPAVTAVTLRGTYL